MPTRPTLRSVVDHDGAVILDIESDQFFRLNVMGSQIWSSLQEGETLDQIKASIAQETGMSQAVVDADVDEFLSELKAKKLLQVSV